MNTEEAILTNINDTVYKMLLALHETKICVVSIKNDIKECNNNYFTENIDICNTLSELLNDKFMNNFIDNLTDYKNLINDKIQHLCIHEWIDDEIDISPEISRKICYCNKCLITKTL